MSHDTRIDQVGQSYVGSCTCGWKHTERYGRKLPVPITGDNAYKVVLEIVSIHNER